MSLAPPLFTGSASKSFYHDSVKTELHSYGKGCAGQKWRAAISSDIFTTQLYHNVNPSFYVPLFFYELLGCLILFEHLVFKITFSLVGSF